MVLFRCKRSGNIMKVTQVDDIVAMRKHESYTEVLNEAIVAVKAEETDAHADEATQRPVEARVLKKRGRPPKVAEDVVI